MSTAVRVVKVGGRSQSAVALPAQLRDAWQRGARPLVVVHGGGDEVSTLQRALGITARFEGGRRVTSAADLDVVRMGLSGSANKRLVAQLLDAGVRAIGLSGEDAALLGAEPLDPERLGHVGRVTHVEAALLHLLIEHGMLPVVSPVSRNRCAGTSGSGGRLGATLNVNGDDAAAAIAVALAAEELLLVSDVEGVLAEGVPLGSIEVGDIQTLIDRGVAAGGMSAKLEAARAALAGGVARVRIGDVAAIGDGSRGTIITA